MSINKLRRVFLLFIMSSFGAVQAQELLPVWHDTVEVSQNLEVEGGLFYHSNALSNEFSNKIIFGGEISDELSREAYENHKNDNRVGGDAKFRIAFKSTKTLFKNRPNISWMMEASSEIHGYGNYSEDLFGLAFMGNTSFLGESINLSNLSYQALHFASIGGGLHNKKTKNFISLNAILPLQFYELRMDRGSVRFAEDGTEIGLKLKGEWLEGNSDYDVKGIGAAINFDYNIAFGNEDAFNGFVRISARNLGVYHLSSAQRSKVDSELNYNGFEVDDLLNNSEFPEVKDTLGIVESTQSKTRLLPGFVQVGKVVSVHALSKWQSTFGVRFYTNMIYRPMVYVGGHYKTKSNLSFGAQGTFGGYGNFRLGLYVNYMTENVSFGIGTEDFLGAIMKSQYGQSGLIRLAWKL